MSKRLYKSRKNKMIDGVCAGIAEYFNIDPTIIRLIAVVFCLLKGVGIILYIIAMVVIPAGENQDDDVDNMKSANVDSESDSSESKSKMKSDSDGKTHSDEEFDNFFKK